MSCSINMTSESRILFCTRGKYVFLNPTLFSKSFKQNTMIIIIIFSSNGRALVPEDILLRYSDIWRQGQLPCLNFHFLPLTHSSRTLLDKHQTQQQKFCSFGSSCGRCIHS